tara:strand:+ start:680 stop:1093 length:414 start_codon:yes stop_codon:yes gene_type:complete
MANPARAGHVTPLDRLSKDEKKSMESNADERFAMSNQMWLWWMNRLRLENEKKLTDQKWWMQRPENEKLTDQGRNVLASELTRDMMHAAFPNAPPSDLSESDDACEAARQRQNGILLEKQKKKWEDILWKAENASTV